MNLIPFYIFIALGAVMLCVFLSQRVKKCSAKATFLKALVSAMFILTWGAACLAKGFSNFAFCIGGGLLFGLFGDIWLDLKFCYKADEDFYTKMGFLCFGVGHVFYYAAVVTGASVFKPIAILPALGVALVAALVVYFGAVLFFMAAFAFFTALFAGLKENKALVVMAIGGALFIISDLILSGTYFGEGKNRPVDVITNHVSYYAAQFVIASAVLFFA